MLIGTFCRFSVRFCAVTVTASRVAVFSLAWSSGAGAGAGVAWAMAKPPMAK